VRKQITDTVEQPAKLADAPAPRKDEPGA